MSFRNLPSLQDTLLIGSTATTQATWTAGGVALSDNVPLTFGTGSDATILYNGTDLIINPAAVGTGVLRNGAATTDERNFYTFRMGLGDTVPTSGALCQFTTSSSTVSGVFSGTLTYSGATATMRTLLFTAIHQGSAATNTALGGAFIANLGNDNTGTKNCVGAQGQCGVNVSITQGTVNLDGIVGQIPTGGSGHTGGTVIAASGRFKQPANVTGVASYTRFAGIFEGDTQIISDKKLLLEGTATTMGDSYLIFNSSTTDIDLFVDGTKTQTWDNDQIDHHVNTNLADATNVILGTTTGTKFGTATTQKIGFWNTTPIVQPTTAVAAATFVANTSGIANDTATFDGYTIGQVVKALRNMGALA